MAPTGGTAMAKIPSIPGKVRVIIKDKQGKIHSSVQADNNKVAIDSAKKDLADVLPGIPGGEIQVIYPIGG